MGDWPTGESEDYDDMQPMFKNPFVDPDWKPSWPDEFPNPSEAETKWAKAIVDMLMQAALSADYAQSKDTPAMNHRRPMLNSAVSRQIEIDRQKFLAEIMLCKDKRYLNVPTKDEWHGVNQLEKDGEL